MKSKISLAITILSISLLSGCLEDIEAPTQDLSGASCTTEELKDKSGLKIICGGDSVGVVLHGKDGKDGKNGENGTSGKDGKDGTNGKDGKDGANGKDGKSCTVKENSKIDGYDVFCGDEKIGSITNGKNGKNGENGTDGKDGKDGKDGTNGKDGKSCIVEENSEIDGYDVICGGEKIGSIINGKDGKNGENGTDGKDGKSCSIKENKDINGFDVICGDEKVGELRNGAKGDKGEKGDDGKDGKDGESCTVQVNEEIKGYDVICGDKKVGELKNGEKGEKGEDGKDGKDGKDGTSCSIQVNDEIKGYDVVCGDKKVGELKNGEKGDKGDKGDDGKDGKSCFMEVNDEIKGYDVICGDKKVGELRNGEKGDKGDKGDDGKDGKSCTVVENKDIDGYDVICGNEKIGELRNGKDAVISSSSVEISSSSEVASSSSVEVSSSSEVASSSSVEVSSSSEVASSSSVEVSSSSEVVSSSSIQVSSSSEVASSSSVETLSKECLDLRETKDVFVSLYDVLGCTRSTEKVSIILRHAARDRNNYGQSGGLNETGKAQAQQVGQKLKALNLDDFYYMHTDVKRTAETAMIISNNKGESTSQNISDWYDIKSNDYQNENKDLLEKWYIKPNKSVSSCQRGNWNNGNSWGWSVYSKFAYEEYYINNYDATQACKDALYDAKSRSQEIVEKYFSYEKAHKYTLAISHDQFLVPFIISMSDKKIHDTRTNKNGQYYDLRFHVHESEGEPAMFDYWINYLTGVVIITDGTFIQGTTKENFIIIPVRALDDAFLHTY